MRHSGLLLNVEHLALWGVLWWDPGLWFCQSHDVNTHIMADFQLLCAVIE